LNLNTIKTSHTDQSSYSYKYSVFRYFGALPRKKAWSDFTHSLPEKSGELKQMLQSLTRGSLQTKREFSSS